MNNISPQNLKEIVDFINLTPFKTDINLFERLNSEELLNIYINCLIYLGAANNYEDFELNEEEENLFATVVKENRDLKVIKVSSLINYLFKKFGYMQDFSPVYIFSPTLSITQSTLMKLLETKKRIEEYKDKYDELSNDYKYTIKSYENIIGLENEAKNKKNILIKTLEEGNKINTELNENIEKYSKKIEELNPLINANNESLQKLNEEIINKSNQSEQLSKQINENGSALARLQERIVPNIENFCKVIDENKILLTNLDAKQNNLQKDLDILNKNNEICFKIDEKLLNLKSKVEEYHNYDIKNRELIQQKEQTQNEINNLEKEVSDYMGKYAKNSEILKNTEIMLKNQQKELNSLKSKLSSQIKENEKIKSDLKAILDNVTNEMLQYKSGIDKIKFERNELQNMRNEFAQILEVKFQNIIKKQNLYYQLLDKSLELYKNYNIMETK